MSKLIFELPDSAYFYKLELSEPTSKTPCLTVHGTVVYFTVYGTVVPGDCALVKPFIPSNDE